MAKEFAKKFYRSKHWKKCRSSYISNRVSIDGGMCERCKCELGYIVHHKVELSPMNINDTDIALNHCLLEYVCHSCHEDIHRGKIKEIRCMFNYEGMPIPPV